MKDIEKKLEKSIKEVELIQKGEIPKITGREFLKKSKENNSNQR